MHEVEEEGEEGDGDFFDSVSCIENTNVLSNFVSVYSSRV